MTYRTLWWFDNPNTLAALLATLIIAVWTVPALSPRGWAMALAATITAGLCVPFFGAQSRGGILSLLAGGLAAAFLIRQTRWTLLIPLIAAVLILAWQLAQVSASRADEQTVSQLDKSAASRLIIYREVPAMIFANPRGWPDPTLAYERWYQSDSRHFRFNDLLSSHLTWLVAWNWPKRIFYMLAWTLAFAIAFRASSDPKWFAIAFGVVLAAALAGTFSGVLDRFENWLLPGSFASAALISRVRGRSLHLWRRLAVSASLTLLATGLIYLSGRLWSTSWATIRARPGYVEANANRDNTPRLMWLSPNHDVVGDRYGKVLRRLAWKTRVYQDAGAIDGTYQCDFVIAHGHTAIGHLPADAGLVLLNPEPPPQDIAKLLPPGGRITVIWGEFCDWQGRYTWQELARRNRNIEFVLALGEGAYMDRWDETLKNRFNPSNASATSSNSK